MTRFLFISVLFAALMGCYGGPEVANEPTKKVAQADAWCIGCSTISSTFEPSRTPPWVTTEGIRVRFPGTTCGSAPPGVLCWDEINVPVTYCGGPPRELDPNVFWSSAESARPFYSTANIYFQPSTLPFNGVQLVRLNADSGSGPFLQNNQVEFEIARRAVGVTFRYREITDMLVGGPTIRTFPRLNSAGTCTARIFGANPETFGNLGSDRVDFVAPQIYQPTTGLRVARDAGSVCGSFLTGYACTRYVHATEIVLGECWFVITRTDQIGARVTSESPPNIDEAIRLRRNATCFSP